MSIDEIKGWQKRLWWSFIYAITAVVVSTIIVGILSSIMSKIAMRKDKAFVKG
jgi:VIT1/CCC1 family predicted Fe2+/Mn2+ transporter